MALISQKSSELVCIMNLIKLTHQTYIMQHSTKQIQKCERQHSLIYSKHILLKNTEPKELENYTSGGSFRGNISIKVSSTIMME